MGKNWKGEDEDCKYREDWKEGKKMKNCKAEEKDCKMKGRRLEKAWEVHWKAGGTQTWITAGKESWKAGKTEAQRRKVGEKEDESTVMILGDKERMEERKGIVRGNGRNTDMSY